MAYVKVSTSKNAVACLRYGEHEKDCVKGGVDCPADTEAAIHLFAADRIMWQKNSGLQAHVIIQSFDGCEVSPADANRLGQELARQVAPGYRAVVYTHEQNEHTAKGNIHNHIVIESVRPSDGKKLDTHGFLQMSRNASDTLCKEAGLFLIKENERNVGLRYTHTEQMIADDGRESWKDKMREAVEAAASSSKNEQEFRDAMKEQGYEISERFVKGEKTWTYKSPEGKRCRAKKLGDDYTRSSICGEYERLAAIEKQRKAQEQARIAEQERQRLEVEQAKKYLRDLRRGAVEVQHQPEPPAAHEQKKEHDYDIGWGR